LLLGRGTGTAMIPLKTHPKKAQMNS